MQDSTGEVVVEPTKGGDKVGSDGMIWLVELEPKASDWDLACSITARSLGDMGSALAFRLLVSWSMVKVRDSV